MTVDEYIKRKCNSINTFCKDKYYFYYCKEPVDKSDDSDSKIDIINNALKFVVTIGSIIFAIITYTSKSNDYNNISKMIEYFGISLNYSSDNNIIFTLSKLIYYVVSIVIIIYPFFCKLFIGDKKMKTRALAGFSLLSATVASLLFIKILDFIFEIFGMNNFSMKSSLIILCVTFIAIFILYYKLYIYLFSDNNKLDTILSKFKMNNSELLLVLYIFFGMLISFVTIKSILSDTNGGLYKTKYEVLKSPHIDYKQEYARVIIHKSGDMAVVMTGELDDIGNLSLTKYDYKYISLIDKKVELKDISEVRIKNIKENNVCVINPIKKITRIETNFK